MFKGRPFFVPLEKFKKTENDNYFKIHRNNMRI